MWYRIIDNLKLKRFIKVLTPHKRLNEKDKSLFLYFVQLTTGIILLKDVFR